MYIGIPATFIVQIIAWKFIDVILCTAVPSERICTRDRKGKPPFRGNRPPFPGNRPTLPYLELFVDDDNIPLGREESYFLQMAERRDVFVDKSLLIKKILETKEKIVVINAPRKSGKTINLNMLKDFFEVRLHTKNETLRSAPKTTTYRFFTTGKLNTRTDRPLLPLHNYPIYGGWYESNPKVVKFEEELRSNFIWKGETLEATYTDPLMIANCDRKVIKKHLAQYAVILLDFKMNEPRGGTDKSIVGALWRRIWYFFHKTGTHLLFKRWSGKQARATGTQDESQKYESYMRRTFAGSAFNDDELINCVLFASKMLHIWTGKEVIILVDNYDMLFEDVVFKINEHDTDDEETQTEIKNRISVLKNFMNKTFVENPYLAKAIFTGTLSMSKKTLFEDMPDVRYYNTIDGELQEFYSFTEGEVNLLFNYSRIPTDLGHRALLFYNGYFGKPGTNITLFNSFSITRFLSTRTIAEYWIGAVRRMRLEGGKWDEQFYQGGIDHWLNFKLLDNDLRLLIKGNSTKITFTEVDYDAKEILRLTRSHYRGVQVTKKAPDINSLLLEMGFFTTTKPRIISSTEPENLVDGENDYIGLQVTKKTLDIALSMLLEMGFFTITKRENHVDGENGDIFIRVPNQEIRNGLEDILNNSTRRFRYKFKWNF